MRKAKVTRQTKETKLEVALDLDGSGQYEVATGVGFLDHMLSHVAVHGLFDLKLKAKGDLQVDAHHTVEDAALALGQAFDEALGDRALYPLAGPHAHGGRAGQQLPQAGWLQSHQLGRGFRRRGKRVEHSRRVQPPALCFGGSRGHVGFLQRDLLRPHRADRRLLPASRGTPLRAMAVYPGTLVPSNGPRARIPVGSGGVARRSLNSFSPTRNLNTLPTYAAKPYVFSGAATTRSSLRWLDSAVS